MRKRFEQQLSLGVIPISEVKINLKTRHQLAAILLGLQYLFTDKELSEQAFEILEDQVLSGKKATGRLGMSLWEILVLGTIRLSLNIDYDFLVDQANEHRTLRNILGVGRSDFKEEKEYEYQTILDNVSLLDDQTIKKINDLVVAAGHKIIKKKEKEDSLGLQVKVDSFVVETTVHFPTDINLLWDCGRKCLDTIVYLQKALKKQKKSLPGWREETSWRKKLRNAYRTTSEIHRKKGKNYESRLKKSVKNYLTISKELSKKCKATLSLATPEMASEMGTMKILVITEVLRYYRNLLKKHIDLLERRIVKGEKIPHEEKMFSIFEQHTRWNNKGKMHKNVELGLPVVIATDQYQFILHHEVMETVTDVELTQKIGEQIKDKYESEYGLSSISFDRGFYSGPAKKELEKYYDQVVMPKPGKKNLAQQQEEAQAEYVALKKSHSAVEANINCLEHHGVSRCPDKGLRGFKRYVALGVLSYNLQHLGKLIMAEQKATMLSKKNKAALQRA